MASSRPHVPATGLFIHLWGDIYPLILARNAGLGFVVLDLEHGVISVDQVCRMAAAAQSLDLCCLVRVPLSEVALLSRVLDGGASGLMIPNVRRPEDLRRVQAAVRYPPDGQRGVALGLGQSGYHFHREIDHPSKVRQLNEETLVVAQVETKECLASLDTILDERLADALFLGPYDLSTSLGDPGDFTTPSYREAVKAVCQTAKARGVELGCYVDDASQAEALFREGFTFLALGSELSLIQESLARLRVCPGLSPRLSRRD